MIRIRISDRKSLGSWQIKWTDESTLDKHSSVHLIYYDPSDLGSLILIRIIPKERTLCQWNLDSGFQSLVESGFRKLYSGFQSQGFRIPREKFSLFQNRDAHRPRANSSLCDNNLKTTDISYPWMLITSHDCNPAKNRQSKLTGRSFPLNISFY